MHSPASYLLGTVALVAIVAFTIWLSRPRRMVRLLAFIYAARFTALLVVIIAGVVLGLTDAYRGR